MTTIPTLRSYQDRTTVAPPNPKHLVKPLGEQSFGKLILVAKVVVKGRSSTEAAVAIRPTVIDSKLCLCFYLLAAAVLVVIILLQKRKRPEGFQN